MIRMLRCECCATMRLLLDVWHVILQRCTTVAQLLGTLPTSIYIPYNLIIAQNCSVLVL